jgi:polyisoprenyl-phosphate glycosyltransferase
MENLKRAIILQPRPDPDTLSLVIPVYNEEEALPYLRERLTEFANQLPCRVEWVLVNDGSRDSSYSFLINWAVLDSRVKVIDLARNFGHQAAVTAGLDHATGSAVVVMDADLQDPPELILEMLEKYREGYDVAFAQRTKRHGESAFKRLTASCFYKIMRKFIHKDMPANTGDFRLMSRDVVDALSHLREGQRFLRGMIAWVGFSQIAIPFERPARIAGKTKYPLYKMLKFAWEAILSFSSAPLKMAIFLGFIVFWFGIGYGVYAFLRAAIYHDLVPGWATLVILQSLIGGTVLLGLGIIGEYIGRIYDEIKQRPIYIVQDYANISVERTPPRAVGVNQIKKMSKGAFNEYKPF